MAKLVWDNVGDRVYESGVDRGVLYLPDGRGIPWNGLRSLTENGSGSQTTPIYFDGIKYAEDFIPGEFSAVLKAFTYPDEFLELEGILEATEGVHVHNQNQDQFGLSYRTKIGTDVDSNAGYKIHILRKLTAIPSQKVHETISEQQSPIEFEWNISAVPSRIPGFKPTAHITIDSRHIDPDVLEFIEDILYGTETQEAFLPSLSDLINHAANRILIRIIDNLDGTWSATTERDNLINMLDATTFEINEANVIFLDADTYTIDNTINE